LHRAGAAAHRPRSGATVTVDRRGVGGHISCSPATVVIRASPPSTRRWVAKPSRASASRRSRSRATSPSDPSDRPAPPRPIVLIVDGAVAIDGTIAFDGIAATSTTAGEGAPDPYDGRGPPRVAPATEEVVDRAEGGVGAPAKARARTMRWGRRWRRRHHAGGSRGQRAMFERRPHPKRRRGGGICGTAGARSARGRRRWRRRRRRISGRDERLSRWRRWRARSRSRARTSITVTGIIRARGR